MLVEIADRVAEESIRYRRGDGKSGADHQAERLEKPVIGCRDDRLVKLAVRLCRIGIAFVGGAHGVISGAHRRDLLRRALERRERRRLRFYAEPQLEKLDDDG